MEEEIQPSIILKNDRRWKLSLIMIYTIILTVSSIIVLSAYEIDSKNLVESLFYEVAGLLILVFGSYVTVPGKGLVITKG